MMEQLRRPRGLVAGIAVIVVVVAPSAARRPGASVEALVLERLRCPRVLVAVIAVIVVVVALAVVFGGADAADNSASISAKVKSGEFRVVVTTTGELRARKAVQIQGPPNMQAAQVYQTRIASLVPEGTVVKSGDLVAELDRSAVAGKHQEISLALQKAEAQ